MPFAVQIKVKTRVEEQAKKRSGSDDLVNEEVQLNEIKRNLRANDKLNTTLSKGQLRNLSRQVMTSQSDNKNPEDNGILSDEEDEQSNSGSSLQDELQALGCDDGGSFGQQQQTEHSGVVDDDEEEEETTTTQSAFYSNGP